jgi:hypothetical protein
MTSQNEWREIAYQEWVGKQGNNSIGTIHNQRGYESYLKQKRSENSSWSSNNSGSDSVSISGNNGYISSAPSKPLFPFVDHLFNKIPRVVHWTFLGISFIAGFSYALHLGHPLLDATIWGIAGIAAPAFAYGLLIISIKLILLAAYLAIVCGVIWAVYWLIIHFN